MRNSLVGLLACLHRGERIFPSESMEEDQGAVKQLAQSIAKIIAPAVSTDEGTQGGNGQAEGTRTQTMGKPLPTEPYG